MNRSFLLIVSALLPGACVADADRSSVVEVRDSAGVEVLTHTEAQPHTGLRLSSEGGFTVGDAGIDLFRVRGGVLLSNGDLVIANAGSHELLYFDAAGELVHRVGGEGDGPGEFENLLWIHGTESGRVVAYDAGTLRLSTFDAQGGLIESRSVQFEPEDQASERSIVGRGFPIGIAPDGRVIAVPWPVARLTGGEGPLPLMAELRSYGADLSGFVSLDTVRLRTWYEEPQPEGPPLGQVLEGPLFVFSSNRRWIAYSEARGYRVTVLEDGSPTRVIVEDRSRVPFQPDSLPEHIRHAADSLPAYRALTVDADGRIWVEPSVRGSDEVVRWRVFSRDGRTMDSIELPVSSTVLDASGDRVAVLERDELGVETVTVKPIESAAPGGR